MEQRKKVLDVERPDNVALEYLTTAKAIPAAVIGYAVALAGTARPQIPPEQLRAALLDWRGDLGKYLLEQLGAAEVLLTVPAEERRLIVPGDAPPAVDQAAASLPFVFFADLPLFPQELERVCPELGKFVAELEGRRERLVARAHVERAMAVTVWGLTRCLIDDGLVSGREAIVQVCPDGVDVVWKKRPTIEFAQDEQTFAMIVRSAINGELVPKRKVASEAVN